MSRKTLYLRALEGQPTEWLVASMRDPSRYMTRVHIALHALALRRRAQGGAQ